MMRNKTAQVLCVTLAVVFGAGCAGTVQKVRQPDAEKIEKLSRENQELSQVKKILEDRLYREISDNQVKLKMMEKGLVITFIADILFDSGKAALKQEFFPGLDKVAAVLRENVPKFKVGIEGHTDNEPIKYSMWKSNWELSAARSLSVLHYLIDRGGIDPSLLSSTAYGEFQPVASNETKEGAQFNRRVEIVLVPKVTRESRDALETSGTVPQQPGNVK